MRRTVFSFSLLLISMIVRPAGVQAQGISEMGAAHAISAGQSQGLMNSGTTGALTGTMNNATRSINASTGAAARSSATGGGSSPTSTTSTRGNAKALRDGDEPPTPAQTAKKAGEVSNKLFSDAQVKFKAGDLVNADKLFRQSLYYRESIWGAKDPAVPKIYEILGDISRKRGAPVEAESCYHRALANIIKEYGPGDAVMAPILSKLGALYLETFKFSDAVNSYTQVYQLLSRKNGDDDQTIESVINLSKAYLGDEDYRLAVSLLREYATKVDKGSESNLPQLASILELYQTALQKTNQTDKLDGVQARSQEVRDLMAAQTVKTDSKTDAPDASTAAGAPPGAADKASSADSGKTGTPAATTAGGAAAAATSTSTSTSTAAGAGASGATAAATPAAIPAATGSASTTPSSAPAGAPSGKDTKSSAANSTKTMSDAKAKAVSAEAKKAAPKKTTSVKSKTRTVTKKDSSDKE